MTLTFETPFFKILLSFLMLIAGTIAVLLLVGYIFPHVERPISARGAQENILSAKRACYSGKPNSIEFQVFCVYSFTVKKGGVFLRTHAEISAPAHALVEMSEHPLTKLFRIDTRVAEIFGSTNQMLINRIAAYANVECAIIRGRSGNFLGFEQIKWAFEPAIHPHC